jgi:hypothetical protein
MSIFGSSMTNLLVGAAIKQGSSLVGDFVQNEIYEGSFLQDAYKTYIEPYNPFVSSTPGVGEATKKVAYSAAQAMLSQGLGVDPRTGQNMPNIGIPSGKSFTSKNRDFRAGRYQGYPQGNSQILQNAFEDPIIRQFAFDYKQAKMPNINVASNTVGIGSSKIGGLDKGYIRSVKS